MRLDGVGVAGTAVVVLVLALVGVAGASRLGAQDKGGAEPAAADAPVTVRPAKSLPLHTLFEPGGSTLRPSAAALEANGQRVQMTGYMADMELPSKGAFYIAARPVHCDESGAGTADLPLDAVRVVAPSAAGKVIPQVNGPVEVTGIFHVGNRTDEEGRVAAFELTLDGPIP